MATTAELIDAVKQNDAGQVQEILEADPALVNTRTDEGISLVTLAQYYGNLDLVKLLLLHNAQLDLYDAAAIGAEDRVAGWLAMKPELANTFSSDGYTPLGLAAYFGHDGIVGLLLQNHADPNAASNNPMQVAPLHSAVAGDHYAIAAKLIEAGANVNATQADGFTPLMGAAQNGNADMVQLLLEHGADAQARTSKNAEHFADMSPLDFAKQTNAQPVIDLLQVQIPPQN